MTSRRAEVLRFAMVGSLGFLVDAGLTACLTQWAHWMPTVARIAAFLAALTVTWRFNMTLTFRVRRGWSSWPPYLVVSVVGFLVNLGIYLAWLHVAGNRGLQNFVGVALGSVCAMGVNYAASRRFVFRQDADRRRLPS